MFDSKEIHIQSRNAVSSLCWDGDTLVDWVAGGHRYHLDGNVEYRYVAYSFPFDAAVVSPSGEYAVIYVKRGTKGLLLHRGEILREINRSFYYAHAYEYPIALFQLKNGQEVMAHCPEDYNRLEIDDLATGKRLTALETRKPADFFFSRLSATRDGEFLFSAGWHWHPIDHVQVFDVEKALQDPSHLDGAGLDVDTWADDSCACFTQKNHLVVALVGAAGGDDEEEDEKKEIAGEQHDQPPPQNFGIIRVFDLHTLSLLSVTRPQAPVGSIMAVGENHILGFYEYPKLFDLKTGAVVQTWPHLKPGQQTNSIIWHIPPVPPLACDPKNMRFAIAHETDITVIQLYPKS